MPAGKLPSGVSVYEKNFQILLASLSALSIIAVIFLTLLRDAFPFFLKELVCFFHLYMRSGRRFWHPGVKNLLQGSRVIFACQRMIFMYNKTNPMMRKKKNRQQTPV